MKALKTGKIKAEGNIDEAFVLRGYCNWKDASGDKGGLASHESSQVHKRAVEVMETLPRTIRDIGEHLSSAKAMKPCISFESISNNTIFGKTRTGISG